MTSGTGEPPDSPVPFGRLAGRGYVLSLGSQTYRILLQVASVTILSRLLTPEDFGLVAMVMVIIGLGEVLRDFGLSGAAIQAPDLTRAQRDNLFWLNTASGAAMMLATAAIAPVLAILYGQPALTGITLGLAPMFLLSGLATQYRVSLTRQLRFKPIMGVEMVANSISLGIGVLIAASGGGYWALVASPIVSGLVGIIGLVACDPWAPRKFRRREGTWKLIHLGTSILVATGLNYASSNMDTFIVGYRFGNTELGWYNRGAQLIRQPGRQYLAAGEKVLSPVLARLQFDPDRLGTALVKAQAATSYPLAVLTGFVVAAADPVVALFLGDGWAAAVPYTQWLAVGVLLRSVTQSVSQGLIACGKGKELRRYALFSTTATIVAIVVASSWGPVAVAGATALAPGLTWLIGLPWLQRHTGVMVRGLRVGTLRILLVAVVAALASAAARAILPDQAPYIQTITALGATLISAP
ncbi:MAG: lipopolysaccharide biosynthesis protein, partial [Propioniciclava sp.]